MNSKMPGQWIDDIRMHMKKTWKTAFFSAVIIGLLVHMPALLSDIPNHDGLDSIYFDQNMITSGRWFLTIACGFSSYFTIPWVIGLLGLFFLGITAVMLTEILEIKDTLTIVIVSGLLVAFPALTSTFAYVFTLDGYMLALCLAVSSVLFVKKKEWGFFPGGVCLGFSLGTYQAYLPFAMILSMYMIVMICLEKGDAAKKLRKILQYFYMGMIGVVFYYVCLRLLLLVQGKKLASYQGINGEGTVSVGFVQRIFKSYHDFFAFLLKGKILFNNVYSLCAVLVFAFCVAAGVVYLCLKRKLWKKWQLFVIMGLLLIGLPVVANYILVVSPNVTYHLLMRYHFVLLLILGIAFVERYLEDSGKKVEIFIRWGVTLGLCVILFHFAVTDNIAYGNLQKKYEKTYAYCLRLLDRIEQTDGYYPGIPIAMIGQVSDVQYPSTDLTFQVTDHMIGMSGDSLLYTGANYEKFMKYYLGASLNILEPQVMETIYYSEEYRSMGSFPAADSIRIVDGIMYIKTENVE